LMPFQVAQTEGRADAGNWLATGARCVRQPPAVFDHHAHPHNRRVPARGDQRAEMRTRGRGFIDMERLWIKAAGESLDVIGLEGVPAHGHALADRDVLEIFHGAAPGSRRRIISGLVSAVITSSRSSIISARHLTKPISGRLLDARLSSTVVRTRTWVPGR